MRKIRASFLSITFSCENVEQAGSLRVSRFSCFQGINGLPACCALIESPVSRIFDQGSTAIGEDAGEHITIFEGG
jgi:hypothetical protein